VLPWFSFRPKATFPPATFWDVFFFFRPFLIPPSLFSCCCGGVFLPILPPPPPVDNFCFTRVQKRNPRDSRAFFWFFIFPTIWPPWPRSFISFFFLLCRLTPSFLILSSKVIYEVVALLRPPSALLLKHFFFSLPNSFLAFPPFSTPFNPAVPFSSSPPSYLLLCFVLLVTPLLLRTLLSRMSRFFFRTSPPSSATVFFLFEPPVCTEDLIPTLFLPTLQSPPLFCRAFFEYVTCCFPPPFLTTRTPGFPFWPSDRLVFFFFFFFEFWRFDVWRRFFPRFENLPPALTPFPLPHVGSPQLTRHFLHPDFFVFQFGYTTLSTFFSVNPQLAIFDLSFFPVLPIWRHSPPQLIHSSEQEPPFNNLCRFFGRVALCLHAEVSLPFPFHPYLCLCWISCQVGFHKKFVTPMVWILPSVIIFEII